MTVSARWRVICNLLLAGVILYAWARMTFVVQSGALTATGAANLKYYTVLSNLLAAGASVFYCAAAVSGRGVAAAERVKFVAAVTISITFLVVVAFLGPLFGYATMFAGPNFWFHLAAPLACVAECALWGRPPRRIKGVLWALLPLAVYGVCYLANVIINGPGEWPNVNDFYGFATWGVPVGVALFGVLLGVAFCVGLALRATGRRRIEE